MTVYYILELTQDQLVALHRILSRQLAKQRLLNEDLSAVLAVRRQILQRLALEDA